VGQTSITRADGQGSQFACERKCSFRQGPIHRAGRNDDFGFFASGSTGFRYDNKLGASKLPKIIL